MGGYSLNTKPTFFGVPKLLSSSPLGSLLHSRIAVSVDEGCASVSTAAIGSGLTFTALYLAGIPDQARLCYGHHSNVFKWLGCLLAFPHLRPTSFKWLDCPADYVPPRMDIFSDDTAPLGFSSPPFCPVDSEHLERSFDLLRYQHAFKQLGVPSVVNSGIRLVTSSTGSGSHGGTSTDIVSGRFGSTSRDTSPSPFLDRPRPSRNSGSNQGAGAGSGSGGNPTGPPGLTAARKPSAQRGNKLIRFGPPPPPPPPPPGTSDADDDDSEPGFRSSSDWDITWKTILLGACVAHLLNKFFPNKKQISRKDSRQSRPIPSLDVPKNKVDMPGADTDLELDSDAITLPSFVDEVLQMDKEVYIIYNHTDRQPVGHSSRLAGNLPHDAFLKQLLTFSAATGKAITILLLLVSYTVLRKIVTAMGVFRSDSTTTTVHDAPTLVDPSEHTNDTSAEADDVRADTAEPPALVENFTVDSTVVFKDAWLANEFQAPVEALDAPVEDFDIEPTAILRPTDPQAPVEAFDALVEDFNADSSVVFEDAWLANEFQAPVEALDAPVEDSDVETTAFSEDDSFWITGSQAPVEAHNAPVEDFDVDTTALSENDSFEDESSVNEYPSVPDDHYDVEFDNDATPRMVVPPTLKYSSFDDDDDGDSDSFSSECVQMDNGFPTTKSFSKIVSQDSFNWDRHGSFKCSTPLTRPGTLSESGSFDYGRGFSEESVDIPVPDSDVANATTTTNIPNIAVNSLQELEKTKKNLDTIIEAQIKRAESTYNSKPRLDRFDSHLQVRNVTHHSLSSSIWASTPGPSSDAIIEAQIKRAESTRSNIPRSERFNSQLQVRNQAQHSLSSSIWASTPGPSSDAIIEAQIKRVESTCSSKPRSDRFDSQLQVRNQTQHSLSSSIWASTPGPSSVSPSKARVIAGTPSPKIEKTQQTPGRRRRHRARGRNRGRGPSGEQSVEEDDEGESGDVSSDVPNWALA